MQKLYKNISGKSGDALEKLNPGDRGDSRKNMEVFMSRARVFFGLTLLSLNPHLGAVSPASTIKEESQCSCLTHGSEKENHQQALEYYRKAFKLSLDGQSSEAGEASECACWLEKLSVWAIDADNFKEHHKDNHIE